MARNPPKRPPDAIPTHAPIMNPYLTRSQHDGCCWRPYIFWTGGMIVSFNMEWYVSTWINLFPNLVCQANVPNPKQLWCLYQCLAMCLQHANRWGQEKHMWPFHRLGYVVCEIIYSSEGASISIQIISNFSFIRSWFGNVSILFENYSHNISKHRWRSECVCDDRYFICVNNLIYVGNSNQSICCNPI